MAVSFWELIIIWLIVEVLRLKGDLLGPNVCKRLKEATNEKNEVVRVLELFCCAGYVQQGMRCVDRQTECPKGFCGEGCIKKCSTCPVAASSCHPHHCCICQPGFYGNDCSESCPIGKYGENCIHTCNCSGHGSCDIVTGSCVCYTGWHGETCAKVEVSKPVCAPPCNCSDDNCDHTTDQCDCSISNGTYNATERTEITTESNQSSNAFIYLVLFAGIVGTVTVVMLVAAPLKFINLFKRHRMNYNTTEPTPIETTGHYDEINPYHEIPDNEVLSDIRTMLYYSTPKEANLLHHARSLDNIQSEVSDNISSIPKYMSLPNLSENKFISASYVNMQNVDYLKTKRYERLMYLRSTCSGGYCHPYHRLIAADRSGNCNLRPYHVMRHDIRTEEETNVKNNDEVTNENSSNHSATHENDLIHTTTVKVLNV